MAKSNVVGELLGWGIAGLGVWWVGSATNWFGLFGAAPAATTTTTTAGIIPATTPQPTTAPAAAPPAASVSLAGPVNTDINNSLQANVSINGTVMNLAVIPGGGAYNTSGVDISSTLAALGVTPAQIYSLMQAAYALQQASATTSTASTATPIPPSSGAVVRNSGGTAFHTPVPVRAPITGIRRGVGAMTGSSRINYVRKGKFA